MCFVGGLWSVVFEWCRREESRLSRGLCARFSPARWGCLRTGGKLASLPHPPRPTAALMVCGCVGIFGSAQCDGKRRGLVFCEAF